MSEWISVNDRLPEKRYETVLVSVIEPTRWIQTAWLCHEGKRNPVAVWRGYPDDAVLGKVSHWMPLPEPPRED